MVWEDVLLSILLNNTYWLEIARRLALDLVDDVAVSSIELNIFNHAVLYCCQEDATPLHHCVSGLAFDCAVDHVHYI